LSVARLVAQFQRGERSHRLEVRLIQDSNGNGGARLRKEVLLDGVKIPPGQVIGQFNAVIFLPQMTGIIEDGPEERRRYLNLTISQANPAYARALADYNQALTQRNALLKLLNERGGDRAQLDYWDEILASRAALLITTRADIIQELEGEAKRVHERLTGSAEVLRLVYQPSYDPLPAPQGQFALPMPVQVHRTGLTQDKVKLGFITRLFEVRNEEIARGVTTIGPHRDEMRIFCNGIDLTDFGSRGQIRTALLSLKLAEVDWLKQKTGQWPVLLLDETLAELDTQRRAYLLDYLDNAEQVLLTTTDMNLFPHDFRDKCERWQVADGNVEKLAAED
ncbi:MAG TPA: DNA replication and repair protein RecF, partial [Anaerolineaceae bacterium]|nr:DNA replication and repair protein RecF [Anaerolineaceae bacterium]